MKFTSVCAFASVFAFTLVSAAPAPSPVAVAGPAVTPAPVARRAPKLRAAAAPIARQLDASQAQNIVQEIENNNDYGNGWKKVSGFDHSDVSDAYDYIEQAQESISRESDQMRASMHGQMVRPISSYLQQQSERVAQASRIVDGGVPALTRSSSAFVSLASAYEQAEATFRPQAQNIIDQVRNGQYNAAPGLAAPGVFAIAGAIGTVFVWTAL